MTQTDRTYHERQTLARHLADKLPAIYQVLESFKGQKMFKVDGYKTAKFETALQPLNLREKKLYNINPITAINIQSIDISTSYSTLELKIRATTETKGTHGINYHDITLNLGRFRTNELINPIYNEPIEIKELEELREALKSYKDINLAEIHALQDERNNLKEQIKRLEDKMPYYSYK